MKDLLLQKRQQCDFLKKKNIMGPFKDIKILIFFVEIDLTEIQEII